MQHGDLNELIHELERLSEYTDEAIHLIHRLIDAVLDLLVDNDRVRVDIDIYSKAIRILEDVLNTNKELCETAEYYMCCSATLNSSFGFGFQSQTTKHTEAELQENDDAARKVAERRKALAEALRTGQTIKVDDANTFNPDDKDVVAGSNQSISDAIAALRNPLTGGSDLMVNLDGTAVNPSEKLPHTGIQISVSDSENPKGDSDFDGIVVPPGKLAGGIPSHCRVCDNIVFSGAHFCPYCGSPVSIDKPSVKLQKVQFSAIAPKALIRGEYYIINVIMYEESYRHIVDELIRTMDDPAQETRSGVQIVSEGAKIKVVLNSQDLLIEDNIETRTWQGDYLDFSFALQLPDNFKKRQILLTAVVYINDVIASKLKFVVKCSSRSEQKIAVSREDVFSAFISYASQDRNRVAAIIQGMKKARPDLDIFFDVDSLRSGDNWELALHEEIEKRDVLFLCWSHFARQSKWVDEEWRYALAHKGIECIEPVPIEPPGVCPPPDELKSKHFNDRLLYIINTEGAK